MPRNRTSIRCLALIAILIVPLLLVAHAHAGVDASPTVSSPNAPTANAWSSGWTNITQNQTITFNHNLNVAAEQLSVELWFKDTATDADSRGIHRVNFGGNEMSTPTSTWHGAYWHNLTANTIMVHRLANAQLVDQVSVRVWVAPTPGFDSGWQTISAVAPNAVKTFDHGLGVTATDLAVAVWFRHPTLGIHQYAFGGLTDGDDELGAYWFRLTDNEVSVFRRPDDTWVEEIRVVVLEAVPPAYDSFDALGGWQAIAAGSAFTFNHNLNYDPNQLTVRAECHDTAVGGAGIHQMWAGGDEANGALRGTHIQRLTANTVQLVRRAGDAECDETRVAIYERGEQSNYFCLPLILNN